MVVFKKIIMDITTEQFEKAYAKGTPSQQYLCSSSGGQLLKIASEYGLDKAAYKKFAVTVGDTVLGFYNKTDLPNLLVKEVGLSEIVAIKMTGDLLDFFTPLTDPNWQPPQDDYPSDNSLEFGAKTVQEEIAEAEAGLKSLRTMGDDRLITNETTYPSLQADILTNNNSAPSPKPPRWGSES